LHVLPSGFVRIRHYGLLSNRLRQERMVTCRALLDNDLGSKFPLPTPSTEPDVSDTKPDPTTRCPCCGKGRVFIVEDLPPSAFHAMGMRQVRASPVHDTS